jgi:glycosyltransferase involved in cell wall biosynthesis
MLSSDSKLLNELSKNARISARTFDLDVHVQKLEEIYEEVTSR